MKNNPIPLNALPTTVSLSPFNAMPPPYPPHLQYTKGWFEILKAQVLS